MMFLQKGLYVVGFGLWMWSIMVCMVCLRPV
jgi:hypothetical protein